MPDEHGGYPSTQILEKYLGRARIATYLDEASGDIPKAVDLYRWNQQLEGELHILLGTVEVSLRNAIDAILKDLAIESIGNDEWTGLDYNGFRFTASNKPDRDSLRLPRKLNRIMNDVYAAHLHAYESVNRSSRKTSCAQTHRAYNHDDIIAALMFGTWAKLVGLPSANAHGRVSWNQKLWNSHLHKAFKSLTNSESDRVSTARNVQYLHRLRNRLAHHENLLFVDFDRSIAATMSLLNSIDPELSNHWVELATLRSIVAEDPRHI